MKKKKTVISLILAAALFLTLLSGCGAGSAENPGERLGLVVGTMFEDLAKEHYPEAELCYFNGNTDLAEALEEGKIDAYMLDEPMGRLLVQSYSDQRISSVIEPASYAFAFAKDSERSDLLREQMDGFIEEGRQNGLLQELEDIWLGTDEARKTVDLDGFAGENGTLRLAVSADVGEPFTYLKDGKTVGYEIDLLARFCRAYGYALEVTDYNFAALLTAVTSGKEDIAAAALAITEERQEAVDFSIPSYEGGVVLVTKNDAAKYSPENLAGKSFGMVTGTMFEDIAQERYPEATFCYYNNDSDLAKALDEEEIDVYMMDEPIARIMVRPYADQSISPVMEPASYAFAFAKDSKRSDFLREQMDAFIKKCRQNGILQQLDELWLGTDETQKSVSFDQLTGENGTVRIAVSTDIGAPFVYFKNGSLAGYEIDLLVRFAMEYGYDLEITSYSFANLLEAVSSGLNDIAACAIAITEKRQEIMNFSLPTYEGGIVLVMKDIPNFTAESFSGKKIGVLTGSIFDLMLQEHIPDAEPEYINAYTDLAAAVEKGKIDAYVADQPVARLMQGEYPNQVIAYQLEEAEYAFMFPKDGKHQEICRQFNEFLEQSWADGTIADVDAIWFGNDEVRQYVDMSDLTAENGVLEMAVSSDIGAPFAYMKNENMVGYDVDLAVRFCRAYGYGLHITDYAFSGLLSAISGSKADLAACSIAITPERLETTLMSEPNYLGGIVIVVRSGESEEEQANFWASLGESFERTFLRESRWKLFLNGLGTTFMITVISMLLGTALGFAIYLVTRRNWKLFNGIWYVLTSIMGKTPVVVILMILYYIVFGRSNLNSAWVSIIGFTLLFTCTVTDLLKMGAGAVSKGQAEAALAQGYSERQTYLRIIFPQSVEHFLPAYKNEVVSLIKATAVVGYIAVQDLTKVSDLVRARTYEAFFPLIATAVIYFVLAVVLTRLIRRINIIAEPQRRSTKRVLRGLKAK